MPAISFIKLKRIIIENSLARALAATYDTFFRNVVLLLHGNGNNAGQNNTFVDNSANNFAITRNGNVTQGTFSPYGDNWSNYFDGTGDYLTVASNSAFGMGSSNFTTEAWIYPTTTGTDRAITDFRSSANANGTFYLNTSGQLSWWNGSSVIGGTGTGVTLNAWNHVALSRQSGIARAYLNGVEQWTSTSLGTLPASCPVGIGGSPYEGGSLFTGYISNVRILKNVGQYTTNFTPSTAPLAVIANTSLLTCQGNRLRDISANNFTITRNGDVSVTRFSPFQLTTPYSSGTSGQSVYFDGNGDYLSITGTSAFNSTGDFTMEAWIYLNSRSAYAGIISLCNASTTLGARITILNTGYLEYAIGLDVYTSTLAPLSQWAHIAMVRSGSGSNNVSCYLNGSRVGQFTNTAQVNVTSNVCVIGRYYANGTDQYWINGYISNARYVVGTAVYSGSTITVPTAPLTAIANTVLLTCQSDSFADASPNNFTITPNGNAAIRLFSPFSSVAQLGSVGGSGYFDGTGDSLTISSASGLCNFAANEAYTFQVWVYRLSTAEMVFIGSASSFQVGANGSGGGVRFGRQYIGDIFFGAGSVPVGTWTHITISRNTSGVTRCWTNGISAASTTDTGAFALGTTNIESQPEGTTLTNGYLCDMRIIKGLALYDPTSSANIEIPSAPLAAIANTSFLLNFTNATIIDNSMMNDLETIGNAQISTSVKKYGTGSLAFNGTTSYLALQRFENSFNIRTDRFTIEGWFYLTNSVFQALFASGNTGLGNLYLDTSGATVYLGDGASNIITFPTSNIPVNNWFHLAVTFDGTTYRIFINGVSVGSSTTLLKNVILTDFYIGARPGQFNKIMVAGYIDDFRITKGVARYIIDFTPPTVQFPDIGAIKVIDQNQIATFSDIEMTTFGNDNIFKIT